MTKATNIGALVSHLSSDLSRVVADLRYYELGLTTPQPAHANADEWKQDIALTIGRVQKAKKFLQICARLLMDPALLAKAEAEVVIPNPKDGWENLVRFYDEYLDNKGLLHLQ